MLSRSSLSEMLAGRTPEAIYDALHARRCLSDRALSHPDEVLDLLRSFFRTSRAEESRWSELSDQFLHQGTITDAAYAAAPHVLRDLHLVEPRSRFEYLVGLASIESARQTDSRAPALATDLADAYHAAIAQAGRFSVELLALEWPKVEFRYILSVIASLNGHGILGDLLFNLDCICGDCPRCGESVYPDEIQNSGYV